MLNKGLKILQSKIRNVIYYVPPFYDAKMENIFLDYKLNYEWHIRLAARAFGGFLEKRLYKTRISATYYQLTKHQSEFKVPYQTLITPPSHHTEKLSLSTPTSLL